MRVSLPRVSRESRPVRRGQFLRDPAPCETDLATPTSGVNGHRRGGPEEAAAEGTRTTKGTRRQTARGGSQRLLGVIKHTRIRGRPVRLLLNGFHPPHRQ